MHYTQISAATVHIGNYKALSLVRLGTTRATVIFSFT